MDIGILFWHAKLLRKFSVCKLLIPEFDTYLSRVRLLINRMASAGAKPDENFLVELIQKHIDKLRFLEAAVANFNQKPLEQQESDDLLNALEMEFARW